jgi:hypothetical protein
LQSKKRLNSKKKKLLDSNINLSKLKTPANKSNIVEIDLKKTSNFQMAELDQSKSQAYISNLDISPNLKTFPP